MLQTVLQTVLQAMPPTPPRTPPASHVDSSRQELRMDASGAALRATCSDGSAGGQWLQDPDTLRARTSGTQLQLQRDQAARISAETTLLRIGEPDVALGCGASGLRVGAAPGVDLRGHRQAWQVEQTVWLA